MNDNDEIRLRLHVLLAAAKVDKTDEEIDRLVAGLSTSEGRKMFREMFEPMLEKPKN